VYLFALIFLKQFGIKQLNTFQKLIDPFQVLATFFSFLYVSKRQQETAVLVALFSALPIMCCSN